LSLRHSNPVEVVGIATGPGDCVVMVEIKLPDMPRHRAGRDLNGPVGPCPAGRAIATPPPPRSLPNLNHQHPKLSKKPPHLPLPPNHPRRNPHPNRHPSQHQNHHPRQPQPNHPPLHPTHPPPPPPPSLPPLASVPPSPSSRRRGNHQRAPVKRALEIGVAVPLPPLAPIRDCRPRRRRWRRGCGVAVRGDGPALAEVQAVGVPGFGVGVWEEVMMRVVVVGLWGWVWEEGVWRRWWWWW
jgi:hypothetical protein